MLQIETMDPCIAYELVESARRCVNELRNDERCDAVWHACNTYVAEHSPCRK